MHYMSIKSDQVLSRFAANHKKLFLTPALQPHFIISGNLVFKFNFGFGLL